MTVLFSSLINRLVAGRGFNYGFSTPFAMSIYAGLKPVAAQIIANWPGYNASNPNFLAHYIGAAWTHPGGTESIHLTTLPPAVNANNTGLGTWCILWSSNVSAVNVAAATLPNTQFIVADVSDFGGTGVIRFTDPNFTSGVSKPVLSGAITVAMV